jgi:CDP-diacylglycerol pyrophosphatase
MVACAPRAWPVASNLGRNVSKFVAVILVAAAFAYTGRAALTSLFRGALWNVVQACVANHALTGAAFPCLEVNVSDGDQRGYAVLQSPFGRPDLILTPTRKVVGVEDPWLQTSAAPNYLEDAWNARGFLSHDRHRPLTHVDVALAVNSRFSRTQDQLHIHIGCLSRGAKRMFEALATELPEGKWFHFDKSIRGLRFSARLVAEDTLAGVNPFRLAAEGLPERIEDRSLMTMVLAGIELADGRVEFVLLAWSDDPDETVDQIAASNFLDHSCSS